MILYYDVPKKPRSKPKIYLSSWLMLFQEQVMVVNLYTKKIATCKSHIEFEENPCQVYMCCFARFGAICKI